mmetsp:Transcript_14582/g.20606  ORF Transcript_14582/g.20606 Transcript_14582/m.20606 type:complete len:396 (-) Transcript_14582:79-1266(-)
MKFRSVPLILSLALSFNLLLASGSNAFTPPKPNMKNSSDCKLDDSELGMAPISEGEAAAGKLKELKKREAELSNMLAAVRREKLSTLRSRPLTIGVVGFGRFGQFIARSFQKYGRVVVTSRSDYTEIARGMGVKYVPLADPAEFFAEGLDVVVLAVSIVSFEPTVKNLLPYIEADVKKRAENGIAQGPLFVDVLSVKEHARQILLDSLPPECDILCTHPMFGPDSGKDTWKGLNFVYEKTRIDQVILDGSDLDATIHGQERFTDEDGNQHSVHEDSEAHVEGMDRMERFLSIWEEEGCRMVPMSCKDHDAYAANSQFITHLMGRILGAQGLSPTPIDTKGFENVLNLVGTTTADSFDLFYGLYKYNNNAVETIAKLQAAMDDVVSNLKQMEKQDS